MNFKDSIGRVAKYQGGQSPIKSFSKTTISEGQKRTLVRLEDGTVLNYEVVRVKDDNGEWIYIEK
jgi:hypothetical protein